MGYRYPHGLGRLPAECEPAVEVARAEAEATFRETLANNKPRQWHQLQAAIVATMTSSFDAFRRQAGDAVQRGHLGVSAAQAGAEEFLETQARAIHGWLVPIIERDIRHLPGHPYNFRRYESNDEFVFSRDMVELVKSSNMWAQFLRELADKGEALGKPLTKSSVSAELVTRRQCWLREFRKQRDMTVQQMADTLNSNPRAVQAIAREDRSRYSTETRDKLLKLIGRSVEEWYGKM
jgi:predicted metal-dependent phosphoesterase TrpH